VLHTEHDAPEVDVHRPVVVTLSYVRDHPPLGDAGDVEHGVDATELLDRRPHHRLDVLFIGDIAAEREHAFADFCGGVLFGAADVAGDDLGALTHEHLHRSLGHARTCTGDDRHLAVQQPHATPLFSLPALVAVR